MSPRICVKVGTASAKALMLIARSLGEFILFACRRAAAAQHAIVLHFTTGTEKIDKKLLIPYPREGIIFRRFTSES